MMNPDDESEDEHKQSTQAIADQPQEEFISPDNIPSKTQAEEDGENAGAKPKQ